LSHTKSHIDEIDFASFLEKLKTGNERSWYQLDFVLKRIVCKWLNRKKIPVNDSIEIYNAVFSTFYEKIHLTKFESFKNLKSYIFSIAENKVKEFYRSKTNRRRNESIDNVSYCKYVYAISDSKQEENIEKIKQVEKCFELLNKNERTVIYLVYQEGKLLKEVAKILAIGESNARVIKHRALGKIRTQLLVKGNMTKP
jgi:RNA polymerase sigma factor (sigma-70 family)